MRFDRPVIFIRTKKQYNEQTGNTESVIVEQIAKLANITDTTDKWLQLIYGKFKSGAYTVIIRGKVPFAFDYLLIGDKRYTVDKARFPRLTTTYFVSGG